MSEAKNYRTINKSGLVDITIKHHILFWSILFIVTVIRWGGIHGDYLYSFKTSLLGFPIHITLCYLNMYYLMPKFLYQKKYALFIASLFGALLAMLLVKFNLTYYLVSNNVWPEGNEEVTTLTLSYAIDMMVGEIYVITCATAQM